MVRPSLEVCLLEVYLSCERLEGALTLEVSLLIRIGYPRNGF